MSKSAPKPEATLDGLTFEQALEQVESIIARVESGDVGLEQSLSEYERGVRLINHCRGKLNRAQQQIEDLTRKLDGAGEADDKGSRGGAGASGDDDEDLPV